MLQGLPLDRPVALRRIEVVLYVAEHAVYVYPQRDIRKFVYLIYALSYMEKTATIPLTTNSCPRPF